MMNFPRTLFIGGALALAVFLTAACKPAAPPPKATGYDMRGIIERLGTDTAPRTFIIHHEADKYMDSMSMPFLIDDALPTTGLAVGDKVAFHVETDPATSAERITALQKLPAETTLNIPPATSTASAPATMKGM